MNDGDGVEEKKAKLDMDVPRYLATPVRGNRNLGKVIDSAAGAKSEPTHISKPSVASSARSSSPLHRLVSVELR